MVTDLGTNTIEPDLIEPVIYHSLRSSTRATALIRMRGNDPLQFSSRLRDLTSALDPTLRLRIVTFSEMKRQQMIGLRLMLLGSSLVIVTVLLLSAAGIYAMMSFTVSQRRKEIGIRAAMGADAGQLLRSIFTKAALQLAAGVVVGIVLALHDRSGQRRRDARLVRPRAVADHGRGDDDRRIVRHDWPGPPRPAHPAHRGAPRRIVRLRGRA